MESQLERKRRTEPLPCKYCGEIGVEGIEFLDTDSDERMRVCWNKRCTDQRKIDLSDNTYRRLALLDLHQCLYCGVNGVFCKNKSVDHKEFCDEHLTVKCFRCGNQARKEVKFEKLIRSCCELHSDVPIKKEFGDV